MSRHFGLAQTQAQIAKVRHGHEQSIERHASSPSRAAMPLELK
jgi:hypothetical protein